ncbi:hypothetical protein PVAND_005365 [Polypedilum vanderplanki]|uniref:CHK kinase-like domain-containing protein n=1 Tax=Polypedilum vanderplanki TaxID=319348 RepID=A0A9J6C069_POLVA|nr:hypothetical protein PVAND_005365 [Polypedilum vanderplanki]
MATRDEQSNNFLNSDALNDEFFVELVESKLNLTRDQFKVRLVLISPATGKNENFLSVVYRAKINVEIFASNERKFVDVIIKAMLSNLPEIKEWSVFPREIFIYKNIIKSFENIWKERANEEIVFGPKCLKVATEPYEVVVLDDLKAEGFQMLNRKLGVDVDQAKLVLSKLAKFHAASCIRYQKDGEISKQLDRKATLQLFTKDSPFYEGYFKMIREFRSVISEIKGFEKIHKVVSTWDPEVMINSFFEATKPFKNGFKILNHGDDWLNNIMFKINDKGITEDVKLLDYQISYWGSCAGDLFYFLISSVKDECKTKYFDEFIEYYHSELVNSLKKLNYDQHIPTLNELWDDLLEKRQFASSILIDIMFICKYDSDQEITMEQFTDPNAFTPEMFNRMYRNDNYLKALKSWLPFLYERGYLNPVAFEENGEREE